MNDLHINPSDAMDRSKLRKMIEGKNWTYNNSESYLLLRQINITYLLIHHDHSHHQDISLKNAHKLQSSH